MAKVSKTHAVAINKLMIPLINSVAYINADEDDFDMFKMYASDIAYNAQALNAFNTSLDAAQLHNNILRQDTMPREHFYNVLVYIEDNALINKNMFACS